MVREVLIVVLVAGSACHDESYSCNCLSPGLSITAESVEVQELQLSGPACTAPQVTSGDAAAGSGFVPGAPSYTIMPNAEGDCTVTVLLGDGTSLEKTVRFYAVGGQSCCAGLLVVDGPPTWDLSSASPADGGTD